MERTRRSGRSGAALAALLLAAAGLAGGCDGGLGLVSTEQEVQFGREAHAQLTDPTQEGSYPVCTACAQTDLGGGLTISAYVEQLGQAMGAIGNPDRGGPPDQIPRWHFTVLQSDEVNAFALPGGYVYVTTALLGMVRNKAELAGIIGHEVGHVTNYHGVERLESFMILSGLSILLFGNDKDMAAAAAGFILGLDNLVSSQDDELEADRAGVKYAHAGMWNPLQMNRFFEDIEALMGGPGDPISEILSSHPPPRERIAQVKSEAAALGVTDGTAGLRVDDDQVPYARVRAAVASFAPASGQALESARGGIPPHLRPFVHACRFDPATRRMVHDRP
jgi:predicted Zn-dependent protease